MGAKARIWVQRVAGFLAVIAGVLLVVLAPVPVPWWARVLVLVAGAVVGLDQAWRRIPAFDPGGRIRWHLPRLGGGRRRCAVTFDDGPSPATALVLDILKAEGVPATFFVLGGNALRWPDLVCRAASEGHAVGLHGQSHRKLTRASDAEVEEQVTRCRDTLLSLGIDPAPVYRTPHGFKSRAVFRLARRLDLSLWAWSRGVWDTDLPPAPVLERRATRFACDGMVLLVHDGRDDQAAPDVSPMLAALPGILGTLKARGFEFVRLTDV